jgi:hypothetical protein
MYKLVLIHCFVSRSTEIYLKVAFLTLRGRVVIFVDKDEILKPEST